jgi:ferritin-like metal-binding protein YciE
VQGDPKTNRDEQGELTTMADLNERDAKLVQYLGEAYGKERELEASLGAHIAMTAKGPYAKRLKQHLKETKAHAKAVERRIKKLGGGGQLTQAVAGVAKAAAKGPLHALRGSGENEKLLKNAKTEYFNEHEEIATYLAIEVFAEKVGDAETAKLAKGIRREEERMAKFLEGQIKALTRAVVGETPRPSRSAKAKPKAKAKRPARSAAKKATAKKAAAKPKAKKAAAKSKAKATKSRKAVKAKAKK